MSRAFVRESDDQPEQPALPRRVPLPPGARNFITPDGARRFRDELERWVQIERPRLAKTNTPDAQHQLQEANQRIDRLQQSLETAVILPPPSDTRHVQFGAIVTVRDGNGAQSRYRIVGVDEVDMDRGCVSWLSPIAKALLNAQTDQHISLKSPSGEQELTIIAIAYELAPGPMPPPG